jgi:sugar phosphate isomerase/epimerase
MVSTWVSGLAAMRIAGARIGGNCCCVFRDWALTSSVQGLAVGAAQEGSVRVFVAVSTRNFAELTFEDACAQIIDLEFDRIELWLDDRGDHQHLRVADVAADPEAFVTRYREATRLSPAAITVAHDITPDAIRGLAKTAKQLRVTQITLPASDLGTPFNAEIERLRELVSVTARDGVRTSIRTQRGTLTEDPHTAVELCQAVPGLGITLDPSHYLRNASPERAMDLVMPYTFHTHLRDSTADCSRSRSDSAN